MARSALARPLLDERARLAGRPKAAGEATVSDVATAFVRQSEAGEQDG